MKPYIYTAGKHDTMPWESNGLAFTLSLSGKRYYFKLIRTHNSTNILWPPKVFPAYSLLCQVSDGHLYDTLVVGLSVK